MTPKRALADRLRGLARALAGKVPDADGAARRVLQAATDRMTQILKKAFDERSRGRADASGLRWKPLAASTLRRKRGSGRKPLIMVDTGALRGSLGGVSGGPDGLLGEVRLGGGQPSLVVTCDVPYAEYQHAQRPIWPDPADWPQAWWDDIGRAVADAIARELRRSGRLRVLRR